MVNSTPGSLKSSTVTFTIVITALLTIGLLFHLANELRIVRVGLESSSTSEEARTTLLHLSLVPVYIRLLLASIVSLWGISSRRLVGFGSCLLGVAYMAFEHTRWRAISQQIHEDERARFVLRAYVQDAPLFSMNNLFVLYLLVCLCLIVIAYQLLKERSIDLS